MIEPEHKLDLNDASLMALMEERDQLRALLAQSEAGSAALRAAFSGLYGRANQTRSAWSCRGVQPEAMDGAMLRLTEAVHAADSLATDTGAAVLRVLRAAEGCEEVAESELDYPRITATSWRRLCDALAALPPALRGAK